MVCCCLQPTQGPTGGRDGLGGYRSTASALNVWRQHRGLPLDISGLPGADKLSAKEAELCANMRLLPAHYLSLKDMMMRDADVHGHISRNDVSGAAASWGPYGLVQALWVLVGGQVMQRVQRVQRACTWPLPFAKHSSVREEP